jgi:hypothetical protein
VQFVLSRAWFYMHGDSPAAAAGELLAQTAVDQALSSVTGAAAAAAAATVEAVKEL